MLYVTYSMLLINIKGTDSTLKHVLYCHRQEVYYMENIALHLSIDSQWKKSHEYYKAYIALDVVSVRKPQKCAQKWL